MTQEEDIKKLMRLLDKGEGVKKAVKDIKTSALQDFSTESSDNIKKEHSDSIKHCKKAKISLIHYLNKKEVKNNKELTEKGEKILKNLTDKMIERIESPLPKVMLDGQTEKFRFRDGSESTFDSYTPVVNTYTENQLLNRISMLENLCSEAYGFCTIIEEQLWHRDDEIDAIDVTEDSEETEHPSDEQTPELPIEKQNLIIPKIKDLDDEEEMEKVINGE